MSTFKATVLPVIVEPHPNADAIELARVGDFFSIIQKGYLKTGDLAVYIPEGALVPEFIQEEIGCLGKLAGSKKNRLKASMLRGVLSQGLCFKARDGWAIGDDKAEELGILKYEAPIPASMNGEISNVGIENTFHFDIENVKRYPDVLVGGEAVSMTEKLHGTFTIAGSVYGKAPIPNVVDGRSFVSSKGFFNKGLVLRDNEQNAHNIYIRVAKKFNLYEITAILSDRYKTNAYISGETFGAVQDLTYGLDNGVFDFRVFNVFIGSRNESRGVFPVNDDELEAILTEFNLKRVPVLYKGPYSKEVMLQHTDGLETYSGKETHMREGIVIEPLVQRRDSTIGRVVLKSVSTAYLSRKGGTELN